MTHHLIGIAGGSGSGKTTLAHCLAKQLAARVISVDDYYICQGHKSLAEREALNFDDPALLDLQLLEDQLRSLREGQAIQKPLYDFTTHCRRSEVETIDPHQSLIVEGIYALHLTGLAELYTASFFVETDPRERYARRLRRDTLERGRTPTSVERQWREQTQPAYEQFGQKSSAVATWRVDGSQINDYTVKLCLHLATREV